MSTADNYFDNIDVDLNHFNELYPSLQTSRENQYFDSDKFNRVFFSDGGRDLSLIHLNIRSIRANGDAFILYLSLLKRKFDVICLTETWVKEPDLIDDIFSDYHSFHSFRQSRVGGGVAIYISVDMGQLPF